MTRRLTEDEAERLDRDAGILDVEGTDAGADVGALGDVNVSASSSIQSWLGAQIAEARRLRGTWPDFNGAGRASRKLDGRDDWVLPVVLSLAEARAIYAGLLDRATKALFGMTSAEATAPLWEGGVYGGSLLPSFLPDVKPANETDEEWLRAHGAHSKYATDLNRNRALFERLADYTGTTSAGPWAHKPDIKGSVTVTIPYASGPVEVLSPQAAYNFLYWAKALAINLDALDGIPDDKEMTWWAIVQAAKETKEAIAKVAKGGISLLLVGGAIVGGVLLLSLLTRNSGPRYVTAPPPEELTE